MRGSGSETGERLHRAYIPVGEGRRNHCFPAAPAPEPRTQPVVPQLPKPETATGGAWSGGGEPLARRGLF